MQRIVLFRVVSSIAINLMYYYLCLFQHQLEIEIGIIIIYSLYILVFELSSTNNKVFNKQT